MHKTMSVAGVALTLLAGPAFAQGSAPSSAEQCGKLLEDALEGLAEKKLSDEDSKKAEDIAEALDEQCTVGKYEEAVRTAALLREMTKTK